MEHDYEHGDGHDHDLSMAAEIPLPISKAGTPAATPYRKTKRLWFNGPVFASPDSHNDALSQSRPQSQFQPHSLSQSQSPNQIEVEIVPPTPPRENQLKELERMEPDFNVGSPRESIMTMATPRIGGGRNRNRDRNRRSRVANSMYRMSQTFHEGTPPPAIHVLENDPRHHISSRRVSNAYVRDGKRSSLYAHDEAGRHSVTSWRASQYHPDQVPPVPPIPSNMGRPGIEHRETNSDETYVTEGTPREGTPSGNGSSPPRRKRPPKADALTILERRRRRDFTIGSHHPLHPPPATPIEPQRPLSSATDASSIQSVKLGDILDRFKSIFQRFGDMPWISDPVCATLVIPRSTSKEVEPVAWYRPRPTIDELVNGDTVSDSATLAPPGTANTAQMKWYPQPQRPEPTHVEGRERYNSEATVVRMV